MCSALVIIPACTHTKSPHPYYAVQVKYVNAVAQGAACQPLILPALGVCTDWDAVLSVADGIMLTGSPSNVHPSHFGQEVDNPELPLDLARDATNLPLIRAAIKRGLTLLAICRGMQEVNVALGGSLHQAVHNVPGFNDHRENAKLSLDDQYGPAHTIQPVTGGVLAKILETDTALMVNSLHGQGINQLAPTLQAEAYSEEGLIEAYSIKNYRSFALAVQWHPEWRFAENSVSIKIYEAFGTACRNYQLSKTGGVHVAI